MDGYTLAGKISEGRFGVVFAGICDTTGARVAIKKIRARRPMPGLNMDPWSRSAEREAEILSQVKHHNVVQLLHHVASPSTGTFWLVYELLALDVDTLLEKKKPLAECEIKILMHMLLTGVAHLHSQDVMHRDIKPSNLLLEAPSGILKVADFGSARFCPVADALPNLRSVAADQHTVECEDEEQQCSQPLTREVCTRWYKSPEMLFGSIDYDVAVDLWAIGCTLGLLLSPQAEALFEGSSDIDQLCCIFMSRGTPTDSWPEVKRLPDFGKIEFLGCKPQPFTFAAEGKCSEEAVDLLEGLLQLNPAARARAADALTCKYFRAAPAAAEPGSLLDGIGDLDELMASRRVDDEFGSDGSDFRSPDWEFESIPIETTSCGLWDGVSASAPDDVSTSLQPAAPYSAEPLPTATGSVRHSTPPPPRSGVHRYKPGVL